MSICVFSIFYTIGCLSSPCLETFLVGLVPWMPQQTPAIVTHQNHFKAFLKLGESIRLICGVKAKVTWILFSLRHPLTLLVLASTNDPLPAWYNSCYKSISTHITRFLPQQKRKLKKEFPTTEKSNLRAYSLNSLSSVFFYRNQTM